MSFDSVSRFNMPFDAANDALSELTNIICFLKYKGKWQFYRLLFLSQNQRWKCQTQAALG